ncbi:MAG: ATP-binding protein [archaeon YNP-WB-062]|jgi:AAA+ ATPase superfamily predicted ATPase|nr:ATP-binding protein [Candidatus Culexarchaeum yellowstonense]
MVYFTLEPKRRREDFYDMEDELNDFVNSLGRFRFIIVEGLRRYGKTSLILTGLNVANVRYLFLDCRLLSSAKASFDNLLSMIEVEVSRNSWAKKLIKGMDYFEVGGVIRFKFRRPDVLLDIFENLGDTIVVFDEVQELRNLKFRFDGFLAYALDHLDVRIVVSSSEAGLLNKFLRVEDPEAPLYGRPCKLIELKPLTRESALNFLKKGFEQEGLDVGDELISEAVENFNGIIGWLTYFGYNYARGLRSMNSIIDAAINIVLAEVEHFLETRGVGRGRYSEALKTISVMGGCSWSEVKRRLEAKLGRIPDTTLANMLRSLMDYGLIVKVDGEYMITDPILRRAVMRI